jgi:long-chain acyl-CoA synthetase
MFFIFFLFFCLFSKIWVYGNSFESFLVAVVNPNRKAVENWASSNGLSSNFEALCEDQKIKEHMLGELSRFAREKKVLPNS